MVVRCFELRGGEVFLITWWSLSHGWECGEARVTRRSIPGYKTTQLLKQILHVASGYAKFGLSMGGIHGGESSR